MDYYIVSKYLELQIDISLKTNELELVSNEYILYMVVDVN